MCFEFSTKFREIHACNIFMRVCVLFNVNVYTRDIGSSNE